MENLTIKELAALAANGTKVYVFDKPEFLQRYLEIAPNGNWAVELTLENCKEYVLKNGYKPILLPLNSLTKEIAINGETFVPIEKLFLPEINILAKDIKIIGSNIVFCGMFQDKILSTLEYKRMNYGLVEKLLSWKFDCFNLIERALAIPVTETFNPYK